MATGEAEAEKTVAAEQEPQGCVLKVEPAWSCLAGTWKLVRSENFDAYLNASGANVFAKGLASTVKPTCTIKVDGDSITIQIDLGIKKWKSVFNVNGEETEAEMPGHGKTKVKTTWAEGECGRLVSEFQASADGKSPAQRVERHIADGELVQTMTIGSVTAKRIFKRSK